MIRSILLLALLLASSPGPARDVPRQERPPRAIPPLPMPAQRLAPPARPEQDTLPAILPVTLSEGLAATPDLPEPARISELSADRVSALLERLPPLDGAPAPASRPGSPGGDIGRGAPPRGPAAPPAGPGAPPADPGAPLGRSRRPADGSPDSDQPLAVLSVLPAGETDLALDVTVVFSEPMVELGIDGEPVAAAVPVELTPEPPGAWRWLDVRTLRFEPDRGRLPGATLFRVRVGEGTRSASGARLDRGFETTFRTAGPRVLGGYPNALGGPGEGTASRRPTLLLVFDQDVSPREVLAAARLEADGAHHPLQLADMSDLEAEPGGVAEAARSANESRWVALRPSRALPPGVDATLTLGPELPSEEGPGAAGRQQALRFRTVGPFAVSFTSCDSSRERCTAAGRWDVYFTNPVDTAQDLADLVTLEPGVRDLRVFAGRNRMILSGDFRPHTDYRLELDARIRDRFGTALGPTPPVAGFMGGPWPFVDIPGGPFVTLDPASEGRIQVRSRALAEVEITLYRARHTEWPSFQGNLDAPRHPGRTPWTPAGPPVARWTVRPDDQGRGYVETSVDLSEALGGQAGHVLLLVRGRRPDQEGFPEAAAPGVPALLQSAAWIQATTFTVGAVWNPEELVAWAMSLEDRTPVEGVRVQLSGGGATAVTDVGGLARLPLEARQDSLLVARRGDEVAILPARAVGWIRAWEGDPDHPHPGWFTVSDRGLYRPGETAVVHGWIREVGGAPRRDLLFPERTDSVRFRLLSPRQEPMAEGTVPVTAAGVFHVTAELPPEARSGYPLFELTAVSGGEEIPGWRHRQGIRVEEFRRREYEVSVEADPGPRLAGDVVEGTVTAAYYDGAGLAGSPVSWRVTTGLGAWTAPGWGSWHFGARSYGTSRSWSVGNETMEARTDARGRHVLRVATGAPRAPFPVALTLEAEVRDVDRQAGSASAGTVVHPAALAAGIRLDRYWLRAGEALEVDVVVVDLEGRPRPGARPRMGAVLEADPARPGGTTSEDELAVSCAPGAAETVGEWTVVPHRCRVDIATGGTLRLEALVRDDRGRPSLTQLRIPVFGQAGAFAWSPREHLEITPDRPLYQPGDTARIAVEAPVYPVTGLLTLLRHGIREVRPLRLDGPGHVEAVALHAEDAGRVQVQVQVDAAHGGMASLAGYGVIHVATDQRRLDVRIGPDRPRVEPGDSVTLDVWVLDPSGAPAAGGEVAVWVVDESVLALGGYRLGDPLSTLLSAYGAPVRAFLPHETVLWERRARGPGVVSARVIDGATGSPVSRVTATLAGAALPGTGIEARVSGGELAMTGVPVGRYRLVLRRDDAVILERAIEVPEEGLDLELVLPAFVVIEEIGLRGGLALNEITVAPTTFEEASEPGPRLRSAARAREYGAPDLPSDPSVELRAVFRALAAFAPRVPLDDEGRGRARIRLPDTMTRYRIFAVATRGPLQFGTGEGAVTATRELAVRAAPPRFLHPGDEAELPVTVQNASDQAMAVEVAVRAPALALDGPRGFRVDLAAGARTELRFPARSLALGDASVDVLAVGVGGAVEHVDALRTTVPVTPALAPRAVAVHHVMEGRDTLRLPLRTPARARPDFGAVEVGLSSTRLQPLTDVVQDLCLDPLFMPEATIARVIGLSSLGPALERLAATGVPDPEGIRALVRSDLDRLEAWLAPYAWGRTPPPGRGLPHFSLVHAVHALDVARRSGQSVPDHVLQSFHGIIRQVWEAERGSVAPESGPTWGWHRATAAYALHVGVRTGAIQPRRGSEEGAWMAGLEPQDLPVEVLAWLLAPASAHPDTPALRDSLLREIGNRAVTTASTVTFRQGGRATAVSGAGELERLVMASDRRSDAAVLAVLLEEEPDHPLIPSLVRGLLGNRDGTAVGGAHENGWVLLALGRYAAVHEGEPPDLTAAVGLVGGSRATEHRIGPGAPSAVVSLPNPSPGDGTVLEITSAGRGPLYVRAGVRYTPEVTPDLPAEERGFFISRRYEAVDDPGDVTLDGEGMWRIRAGARVRVRLTLTAPERRYQVQLGDPLPAGLEVINPALQGTGFSDDPGPPALSTAPRGAASGPLLGSLWSGPFGWEWTDLLFRWRASWAGWASHEELRDDRMDAYAPYLPAGTWETTYLVRATTPGRFLAPPPRVEEAGNPETFGQGRPDRVEVEVRDTARSTRSSPGPPGRSGAGVR